MFDKMIAEYSTLSELQEFAQAQQKTLLSQSQRIQDLQAEIIHLKGILSSSAPAMDVPGLISIDDQEQISRMQMHRLKDVSLQRELTLEEARKLEIYSKIINQIENRPKKDVIPTKAMSTEKLLDALNEPGQE